MGILKGAQPPDREILWPPGFYAYKKKKERKKRIIIIHKHPSNIAQTSCFSCQQKKIYRKTLSIYKSVHGSSVSFSFFYSTFLPPQRKKNSRERSTTKKKKNSGLNENSPKQLFSLVGNMRDLLFFFFLFACGESFRKKKKGSALNSTIS